MNTSLAGIDDIFRALGDPTRRAIVERLAQGPASVSDLASPFEMSLPAVHQHLGILEDAGLIRTAKNGRTRTCRIEPKRMRLAEDWFVNRRALWERRLDSLAEHLAREKEKQGGKK